MSKKYPKPGSLYKVIHTHFAIYSVDNNDRVVKYHHLPYHSIFTVIQSVSFERSTIFYDNRLYVAHVLSGLRNKKLEIIKDDS